MSSTIDVFTHKKPTKKLLRELANEHGLHAVDTIDGKLAGNIVIQTVGAKPAMICIVDGPFTVDSDDLPDELLEQTTLPKWWLQLTVSEGKPKTALTKARAVGQSIKTQLDGYVLIDDKIVGRKKEKALSANEPGRHATKQSAKIPKTQIQTQIQIRTKAKAKTQTKTKRGPLVTLEFHFPRKQFAKEFIKTARSVCSEAVPTKFGYYEPLTDKLTAGNERIFIKEWQNCLEDELNNSFLWKATYPCMDGIAIFSQTSPSRRKKGGEGTDQITLEMSFDGSVLEESKEMLERVVALFKELSSKLDAFYSAGFVRRNVFISPSGSFTDGESESLTLQDTGVFQKWVGIPRTPTWLAWFGQPYLKLLKNSVAKESVLPSGIFIRTGTQPLDTARVRKQFPRLPEELLAKEKKAWSKC